MVGWDDSPAAQCRGGYHPPAIAGHHNHLGIQENQHVARAGGYYPPLHLPRHAKRGLLFGVLLKSILNPWMGIIFKTERDDGEGQPVNIDGDQMFVPFPEIQINSFVSVLFV